MLAKLPLAEGASEETTAVLAPLQIEDECTPQLSLGEDQILFPLFNSYYLFLLTYLSLCQGSTLFVSEYSLP